MRPRYGFFNYPAPTAAGVFFVFLFCFLFLDTRDVACSLPAALLPSANLRFRAGLLTTTHASKVVLVLGFGACAVASGGLASGLVKFAANVPNVPPFFDVVVLFLG